MRWLEDDDGIGDRWCPNCRLYPDDCTCPEIEDEDGPE